jgi:membrane protein
VTYSQIYGTLGILPVFLVGLYFSWLIVLLGAQVSYAMQNVQNYLHQRAGERIDEHGRELIACRAVAVACEHFLRGAKPPRIEELAERIGAPPQWLNQLLYQLQQHGLVMRVADEEQGLVPARPPEAITIADVIYAVRHAPENAGQPAPPADPVEKLLTEFDAALRSSPGNRRFSDIIPRS